MLSDKRHLYILFAITPKTPYWNEIFMLELCRGYLKSFSSEVSASYLGSQKIKSPSESGMSGIGNSLPFICHFILQESISG